MSEPYLGQLMCVGFNFANRGWANCDGQLLPIAQYSALFSLFGTMYGGDGRTTFGLPGLQGRVPIHVGTGPGLPAYRQGEKGGAPTVTLVTNQIPAHNHALANGTAANQASVRMQGIKENPNTRDPEGSVLGQSQTFNTGDATVQLGATAATISGSTALSGGSQPHENMQPYQVLRWLVALQGLYPSRS